MENTRDLRFYDFDNRFPDIGTNEEIMTYLRELRGQLNMAFDRLARTTDALTLVTATLEDDMQTAGNKIHEIEDRVYALEESDE